MTISDNITHAASVCVGKIHAHSLTLVYFIYSVEIAFLFNEITDGKKFNESVSNGKLLQKRNLSSAVDHFSKFTPIMRTNLVVAEIRKDVGERVRGDFCQIFVLSLPARRGE